MKASRFSDAQKAFILKQGADGAPVAEICRKAGISQATYEAFNGRFQAERLNTHWLLSLADAREKLEAWRRHYNEDQPHGAIGYKAPIALMNPDGEAGPPS